MLPRLVACLHLLTAVVEGVHHRQRRMTNIPHGISKEKLQAAHWLHTNSTKQKMVLIDVSYGNQWRNVPMTFVGSETFLTYCICRIIKLQQYLFIVTLSPGIIREKLYGICDNQRSYRIFQPNYWHACSVPYLNVEFSRFDTPSNILTHTLTH